MKAKWSVATHDLIIQLNGMCGIHIITDLTSRRFCATWIKCIYHTLKEHQEIGYPSTHKALLLLDVFKGQTVPSILLKLGQANIDHLFIPPNCTDRLQPLVVSINKPIKSYMKGRFIQWYSERVQEQLRTGKWIEDIKVMMKLSVMKAESCN